MFRTPPGGIPRRRPRTGRALVAGAVALTTLGAAAVSAAPAYADDSTTPVTNGLSCYQGDLTVLGANGVEYTWERDADDGEIEGLDTRRVSDGFQYQSRGYDGWGDLQVVTSAAKETFFDWDCDSVQSTVEGDLAHVGKGFPWQGGDKLAATAETRVFRNGDYVRRTYAITNTGSTALTGASATIDHSLDAEDFTYVVQQNDWNLTTTSADGSDPVMAQMFGSLTYKTTDDVRATVPVQKSMSQAESVAKIRASWAQDINWGYLKDLEGKTLVNWGAGAVKPVIDATELETDGFYSTTYQLPTIAAGKTVHIVEFSFASIFDNPEWMDPELEDGQYGKPYTDSVARSDAGYKYTLADGALPAGLTLAEDGSITGVPTEWTHDGEDWFEFAVWAEKDGDKFAQAFEMYVDEPEWIDETVGGSAQVGVAYSDGVEGPDLPDVEWEYSLLESALPAGLDLDGETGAITGTPTAAGSVGFTVEAKDGDLVLSREFSTLVKLAEPVWTDSSAAKGYLDAAYSDSVAATHATGYALAEGSAPLPLGLTLGADGTITGIPREVGSFTVTVVASNADDQKEQQVTVVIAGIDWVDEDVASGRVGEKLTDEIVGPDIDDAVWTYTLEESELPAGLTLNTDGTISGTPTEFGSTWVYVKATSGSLAYYENIHIAIKDAMPVWTDTDTADGYAGIGYSDAVAADHAVAYALVDGDLPDGLELDADGSLVGTPTKEGSFTYTVAAYNRGFELQRSANPMGESVEHEVTTEIHGAALGLTLQFKAGDVAAGAKTALTGSGLKPTGEAKLVMHSDPVVLDTHTIGADGMLGKSVALPAQIPAGAHELTLTGFAPDGEQLTARVWFSVDANGRIGAISYTGPVDNPVVAAMDALASTGVEPASALTITALALLMGAALLAVVSRRRRADGQV